MFLLRQVVSVGPPGAGGAGGNGPQGHGTRRAVRAFAVTQGRSGPEDLPPGPARIAETPRLGLVFYPEAGILALQSRRLRTGGVVLSVEDLDDRAVAVLKAFVAAAEGG